MTDAHDKAKKLNRARKSLPEKFKNTHESILLQLSSTDRANNIKDDILDAIITLEEEGIDCTLNNIFCQMHINDPCERYSMRCVRSTISNMRRDGLVINIARGKYASKKKVEKSY